MALRFVALPRLRSPRAGALAAVILALVLSVPVQASSPSVGLPSPWGGQRGTELDVVFPGGALGDAQGIFLYEPGIEIKSLEPADNQVKAHLVISPDCRIGIHDFRIRTAGGISNLRTFHVGAMPEASEAEPNSDFAQPQPITLNVTVNGVVENEDVDYFVVEAKLGTRLSAEIEGLRMGNAFFDPYLAIMNEGRFELVNSDDAPLVWQDGVVSIVAPADGKYIFQVRESAFGGSGACQYRLHVGTFPRPTAVLPAGGRRGTDLEVRYLGDVLGEKVERTTLPAELLPPSFGLFARDDQGIAPSANVFRVTDLDNVMEVEPNNALAEATAATAPIALNGIIGTPGDIDCFKFTCKANEVYDIQVYARTVRSPLDTVLTVLNSSGGGVVGNDDNGGPDSYVRFQAPADGEYTVHLRDHLSKGGPDYVYRVEITPVKATLTTSLPEQSQFVDIVAPVPRGNRIAMLVAGNRANFGGDLSVEFKGLPPGITFETVPMPANHSTVPVLLTAAPDAPLGGALVDVYGRWTDPNQSVEGHLVQQTSLIRGQNNIRVWDRMTHSLATAVTDEIPYAIEIVEPKVPLVRGGVMNLKVRATRKEGFTAPIAVRLLYNPGDVGSSGGIAIPEGQTEALIPMNAGGGAELRTFKIAVLGDAGTPKGPVQVSSQLANLTISEPYVSLAFQASAVEQGKETDVVINVSKQIDWEGPATVELLGLPHEVTTEPQQITKESTEVVFKVKTTANSPAGKHPTLLARVTITINDEPIVHMIGGGELRIDTPLPAAAAPAPMPMPEAAPMPEKPPEKRLTRLEQLRLDRQEAKEQAKEKPAEAAPAEGAPAEPVPTPPSEGTPPAETGSG
ncbi:MAG: PPC domain-containing protein [Pirellulales bacterium]|nr:PPC domain-containing protein [Pirellulales bacterium]